jgi:hypothetical protein
MIEITKNGVQSSYNIEEMLLEDAEWLAKQGWKKKKDFVKLAKQIELGQREWNYFWTTLRELKEVNKLLSEEK